VTLALFAAWTLRVSLVLLLALAVAAALRGRSAAVRRQVLATGIAGALLLPLLTIALPEWRVSIASRPSAVAPPAAIDVGAIDPLEAVQAPTGRTSAASPAAAAPATRSNPPVDVARLVVLVWSAGVLVSLAVLGTGLLRLNWLSRRAELVDRGHWADVLRELASHDSALERIRLLQSSDRSLLVAYGWLRPRIVVPPDALSWDRTRIRVVLEHETEHVRRGDWPLQLAAELVRALAWFNPIAWIAASRLRLESEHACDDAVIQRGIEPSAYAEHLVALARTLTSTRRWVPAPAMARVSSLERRVNAMLDNRVSRAPISRFGRMAIGAAGLVLTASIATVAAQSQFASLSGTIRDQLGGTIPDATLSLTHEASGAKHEVKTDRSGRFEFVGLVSGNYDLDVWRMGFESIRQPLQLAAGQASARDMTLALGTLEETVRVADGPASPPVSRPPSAPRKAPLDAASCSAEPNSAAITPPVKLRDVRPQYPPSLAGTGRSGRVVLQTIIGTDGTVREVRTVEATSPEFEAAAADAVRQWRFSQTLLNCVPMDVEMRVTASFDASGSASIEMNRRRLGDAAIPAPPLPPAR
jgi:TonB family protein